MKTLVIGATGYVGRSVVRRLRESGHEVAGLARSETAQEQLVKAGVTPVPGDVANPATILAALPSFDSIVFTPQVDIPIEHRAVEVLLDAMAGSGKRFIFTSGTAVLAEQTDGDWSEATYAEDDPFPRCSIVASRCDTEDSVRAAAGRGIHAMVIRPPLIWGYGRQPGLSALHGSAHSGAVCYLGRGLNLYSSIHVDDLADIFALALERGKPGALYHAVSGETNWRSLAEEVARLRHLPTRSVDFAEAQKLFGTFVAMIIFSMCSRIRCPRTREELGWAPSPDRLDIFAEMGHPSFMEIKGASSDYFGLTYGQARHSTNASTGIV